MFYTVYRFDDDPYVRIDASKCGKGKSKTIECGNVCRKPENCKLKPGGAHYTSLLAKKRAELKKNRKNEGTTASKKSAPESPQSTNKNKALKSESKAQQFTGKRDPSDYKLVDVSAITSKADRSKFDARKIDELSDQIVKNGLFKPILLRQTGLDKYEVLSGELEYQAALEAKRKNPRKAEMISAFVVPKGKEEAAVKQAKLIDDLLSTVTKPDQIPSGYTRVKDAPEFYMVDANSIEPVGVPKTENSKKRSELALSIIENGLLTPIPLYESGFEQYRVLGYNDLYHAAMEAKKINPRAGEMVNAFVVPRSRIDDAVKQLNILKNK